VFHPCSHYLKTNLRVPGSNRILLNLESPTLLSQQNPFIKPQREENGTHWNREGYRRKPSRSQTGSFSGSGVGTSKFK
jgi:hypothetical protein